MALVPNTIEEDSFGIQEDGGISAAILGSPGCPRVFEDLLLATAFRDINVRSSFGLQLKVNRAEYFGRVRINFLEQRGVSSSKLQDLKDLFMCADDRISSFTQCGEFERNEVLGICPGLGKRWTAQTIRTQVQRQQSIAAAVQKAGNPCASCHLFLLGSSSGLT